MEQERLLLTGAADNRSVLTRAYDQEFLRHVSSGWEIPQSLPTGVERLWKRAVAQFCSAPFAYENFTDAVRTGFEAVDAALRHHIQDLLDDDKKLTLGPLIKRANQSGLLTEQQYAWLSNYALHFRNRLTHSDGREPMVLTPGMAAGMLEGIARFLSDLLDEPDSAALSRTT